MIDQQTFDRVAEFHGHMCPGLAMGALAASVALKEIGPHSDDEEIVAIVETDMCGVDAIQCLTGCTFGKGNLVHRDWGKNAYTFIRRSDGKAIRVAGRLNAWKMPDERRDMLARVRNGTASEAEQEQFGALHREATLSLLERDPSELFTVQEVEAELPPLARVFASVPCQRCGEGVMETRVRRFDGQELCQPCFEAALAAR